MPDNTMQVKEGTLRLMTQGEIAMARRVYGDSIVYSRVWVHCDSYLPFKLQKPNFAMSPNGEIWFRKEGYAPDFSSLPVNIESKYVFIHELGHVWQHQSGQWVRLRGSLSWAANYTYRLDKERLVDYSPEQQASILADYWSLLTYGIETWRFYQHPNRLGKYRGINDMRDIPSLYKKIITRHR